MWLLMHNRYFESLTKLLNLPLPSVKVGFVCLSLHDNNISVVIKYHICRYPNTSEYLRFRVPKSKYCLSGSEYRVLVSEYNILESGYGVWSASEYFSSCASTVYKMSTQVPLEYYCTQLLIYGLIVHPFAKLS